MARTRRLTDGRGLTRLARRFDSRSVAAALVIAAQAAWWAWLALPGFFQLDDYFYLSTLRLEHPSLWDWLGRIYFEHFAPGHRLAFWLVGTATPTTWTVLQLVLIALFIGGLVAFWKSLELLFGRSWWLLVPLAAAGFAWGWSLGFAWPSAGLHIIPAFAFGSLSTYAFLRHLAGRQWGWLALSVLALVLGLMFFIRLLILPIVLVLIRYLFLAESLQPRDLARALWTDRWRWLAFLVPAVVYAHYFAGRQGFDAPVPSLSVVEEYLRVAWFRALWPGFFGVRLDDGAGVISWPPVHALGGWRVGVEIGAQAALAALVVLSFMRKGAAAARAWAYVLGVTAVTFLLTIRGRVGDGGPGVGYDPRYISDLYWLLPLGITFALHPRRVLVLGAEWPAARRRRRAVMTAGVAVAAAATVVLALFTSRALQQDRGVTKGRAWVDNVRAGLARINASGRVPTVADGVSPSFVWDRTRYAQLLPLLGEPVHVGGRQNARILTDGEVRPQTLP